MDLVKNKTISESLKDTREKRKGQTCKVFELKVDKSKLSKETKEKLPLLFLEAKWFYNYMLSDFDVFKVDGKIKNVVVKIADIEFAKQRFEVFDERHLDVLGSHPRQSIIEEIKKNIGNLSKAKKQKRKIGKLKFKREINCINLKQFGNSYDIEGNFIRVQGIKQWLRVRGLEQIKGCEIANAKFIRKSGDYYLKVTCFKKKEKPKERDIKPIGIDFGIKTQLTFSNGIQVDYRVEITPKFKRKAKNFSKKKGYKNREKDKIKLQKEYEHFNNKKHDIKNKIIHILNDEFSHICYQNDNMQGWQKLWGRRMLNTAIGGIIADFRKSETAIEVDRFFASTKQCRMCNHKQIVGLNERTFICESCNHTEPRDLHSARSIEQEGLSKIGVEYTDYKPAETGASTLRILERFRSIPTLEASLVCETGSLAALAAG